MRKRRCVPRTANRLQFGNALIHRRKKRRFAVRFGLIPVGHRIIIVRAVIGVTVLNSGANRFGERNRRIEVETIDRGATTGSLFALYRRSVEEMGKAALAEVPRAEKIIL